MAEYDDILNEIKMRRQKRGALGSDVPGPIELPPLDFGGYTPPDTRDEDLARAAQGLPIGESPEPSWEKALALQRLNPPKPGDWLGDPSDPAEIKKMLEARAEKAAESAPKSMDEALKFLSDRREKIKAARLDVNQAAEELAAKKSGMSPAQFNEAYTRWKAWEKDVEDAREADNKILEKIKNENFNPKLAVEAVDAKLDANKKSWVQFAQDKLGGLLAGKPGEDAPLPLIGNATPLGMVMDTLAAPQRAVMGAAAFGKELVTGGDPMALAAKARIDEQGNDRGFFGGWAEMGKQANEAVGRDIYKAISPVTDPILNSDILQNKFVRAGLTLSGVGTPLGIYLTTRNMGGNPGEFDRGAVQLGVEIATDPLTYLGPGAILKIGGKLAKIAPVARKSSQLASKFEAMSEVLKPLGFTDAALAKIAKSEDITADLVKGFTALGKQGDEIANAARSANNAIDARAAEIGKSLEAATPGEFIKRVAPSLEAVGAGEDITAMTRVADKYSRAKSLLPQESLAKQVDAGQRSELWKPVIAAWRGASGPAGEILSELGKTKLGRPFENAARGVQDAFSKAFISDIPLYVRDSKGQILRDAGGNVVKNDAMIQAAASAELTRAKRAYGLLKFTEEAKAKQAEFLNALPENMRAAAEKNVASAIEVIPGQERLAMAAGGPLPVSDSQLPPFAPAPGMPGTATPVKVSPRGYITQAGLDQFPGYERAFLKYVNQYDNDMKFLRQLERANSLPTAELMNDVVEGYFGRVFSQRFQALLTTNPSVANILREGREEFLQASAKASGGFLKERKLADFTLEEAEAFIRKKLGDKLPPGIDVFERNATKAFSERAQSSARALDRATSMEAFMNKIGEVAPGADNAAAEMATRADASYDEAYARYLKKQNDAKTVANAADDRRFGAEKLRAAADVQETQINKIDETLAKIETERGWIDKSRKGQTRAKEVAQEKAMIDEFWEKHQDAKYMLNSRPEYVAAKKNYKAAEAQIEKAKAALETASKIGTPEAIDHAVGLLREANKGAREARRLAKALPGFKETQAAFASTFKELHEAYMFASEIERKALKKQILTLATKAKNAVEAKKAFAEILKPINKAVVNMTYLDEVGKLKWTQDVRVMRDALQKMRIKMREAAPAWYKNEKLSALAQAKQQGERLQAARDALKNPKIASTLNAKKRTSLREAQEAHPVHVNMQRAEGRAAFVKSQMQELGIAPKTGYKSALELYEKTGVRLPDSLEELTKLAATHIKDQDFRAITDLHTFAKDAEKLGKAYDETKRFFQRAVLASPLSAVADTVGTQAMYAAITNGDIGQLGRALEDIVKNASHEDILYLAANHALDTQTSVERAKNILAVASEEGRFGSLGAVANKIHTEGFGGAALGAINKKAGKAFSAIADKTLEVRELQEKVARLATFRHYLAKGYSRADAVQEVIKWWPKFQQLTKMERSGLGRLLFFYSFTKKSLAPAARLILERPLQARYMLALTAGNVRDEATAEKWQREQGGTVLLDRDGRSKLLSMPGSWLGSLYGLMQAAEAGKTYDRGTGGGLFGSTSGFLGSKLAPIPRALVEFVSDRSLNTGKKIGIRGWSDTYDRQDRVPATIGMILDLLGTGAVVPVNAKDGSGVEYYRMRDPVWAWLIESAFPGIRGTTRITDVAALGQSRGFEKLGAAAVGLRLSDIDTSAKHKLEIELRGKSNELVAAIGRLEGDPLAFDNGRIGFNPRSQKGQMLKQRWEAEKANFGGAGLADKIEWLHRQGETDIAAIWHLADTIDDAQRMVAAGGEPGDITFGSLGINLSADKKLAAPDKLEPLLETSAYDYRKNAREKARARKLANKIR